MARVLARLHSAKPPISDHGSKAYNEAFNEDENGQLHPVFQEIQAKEYLKHLKKETPEIQKKYCNQKSILNYKYITMLFFGPKQILFLKKLI